MRGLAFWGRMALCLPQAMAVRARAPRLPAAPGPSCGQVPVGTSLADVRLLQLLGVGDSIIAGVGATDSGSALVASLARALAHSLAHPVAWRTLARSGADARAVHRQVLAGDAGPSADLMVVSVGVNDVIGLNLGRRWQRDLATLAVALRRHSPDALIALVGLPPLDRFPLLPPALARVLGGRARAFDAGLAELAAGERRLLHVPIGPAVGPELFSGDGFHPGDAGYRVLAGLVAKVLLERWRSDPLPPGLVEPHPVS
ncbi:MAG: SGNH/GDSL hydrolase family protein [Xanthomonadales bacterium]|nr:SGNH/GDSL hydrolase family protein [Xanthomonadales bacterium]